jgi:hypothetical protein
METVRGALRKYLTAVACGLAALATAAAAQAEWKAARQTPRIGDPPSCSVRWSEHGIAVVRYHWPSGDDTDVLIVGDARPQGPLEVFFEGQQPIRARAADRRIWSQPLLLESLLASDKFRVAWQALEGEYRSAEISLDGFAAAHKACVAELAKK